MSPGYTRGRDQIWANSKYLNQTMGQWGEKTLFWVTQAPVMPPSPFPGPILALENNTITLYFSSTDTFQRPFFFFSTHVDFTRSRQRLLPLQRGSHVIRQGRVWRVLGNVVFHMFWRREPRLPRAISSTLCLHDFSLIVHLIIYS